MIIFLTEKSLSGILSALYRAFTLNVFPDDVKEKSFPCRTLTDEYITINGDPNGEKRVKDAVLKYGGERSLSAVKVCLLSCDENALKYAFGFLKLTLNNKQCELENLSEKAVADFLYCTNKVLFERHRFTGFLRFKETENGILYAPYSPDNDITRLLMPHFISRLSLIPFVIHDLKRKTVGISDGKTFKMINTDAVADLRLSDDEKDCERLFRSYYNSVNIKERKNLKQQDNFLPRRYRKNMPETFEKPD